MNPFPIYPWQQDNWRDICRQWHQDRLAHAYLLCGEADIGKRQFASAMAGLLLCERPQQEAACGECRNCILIGSGNQPDLLTIAPTDNSRQIRIEQIRELGDFLAMTTHSSARKIVILYPADMMNTSAANALLKTLEEPAGSTLLLLVSDLPGRLLPTLRSRCQKINFSKPDPASAMAWLARVVDWPDMEALLIMAEGKPLLAKRLVDSGDMAQREVILRSLAEMLAGRLAAHEFIAASRQLDVNLIITCYEQITTILIKHALGSRGSQHSSNTMTNLAQRLIPKEGLADSGTIARLMDFQQTAVGARQQMQGMSNPNPALILETLTWQWCQLA
ncbi:MAG: hypothetical protein RLZZ385_176 [Pseudomonadota bacterium]|jgi:DNA polymerase-3 subunit delta'